MGIRTDEERAKLRMPRRQELEGTSRTRCSRRRRRRRAERIQRPYIVRLHRSRLLRGGFRAPPPQAHLHLARLADARSPRPIRRAARQVRRRRGEGAELLPKGTTLLVRVLLPVLPGLWFPWLCWGWPLGGPKSAGTVRRLPFWRVYGLYDFASLHQKDPETGGRTGEEKTAFDSGARHDGHVVCAR